MFWMTSLVLRENLEAAGGISNIKTGIPAARNKKKKKEMI